MQGLEHICVMIVMVQVVYKMSLSDTSNLGLIVHFVHWQRNLENLRGTLDP